MLIISSLSWIFIFTPCTVLFDIFPTLDFYMVRAKDYDLIKGRKYRAVMEWGVCDRMNTNGVCRERNEVHIPFYTIPAISCN
jgi:hypothetical protein